MLVANLGPEQPAGELGGTLRGQTAELPLRGWIDVTSFGHEGETSPFLLLLVPPRHDHWALSREHFQGGLGPVTLSRKTLNTTECFHGDLFIAGDQLARFNAQVMAFGEQDEVVDHDGEFAASEKQFPHQCWVAARMHSPAIVLQGVMACACPPSIVSLSEA